MWNYQEGFNRCTYSNKILKQCSETKTTETIDNISLKYTLTKESKDFLYFYKENLAYIYEKINTIFKLSNSEKFKVRFGTNEFPAFEELLAFFADKREETMYQTVEQHPLTIEKIKLLHCITTHNKNKTKTITEIIIPKYIKDFIICIELLNKSNNKTNNTSFIYLIFCPSNLYPRGWFDGGTNILEINKIFYNRLNTENYYLHCDDNITENELNFLAALCKINQKLM